MQSKSIALTKIPTACFILLSGIMTVFAFPPFPSGFLAYFALVPLIYTFWRADFHFGFEKGYFYGFVLNFGILYWLALNKGTTWYWATLSMLSAVFFVSLNYGAIGLLVGFIGRRLGKQAGLYAFALVWVAIEYIRTFGTLGFTWNNLAYTQSHAVQLIQMAAVIGPSGVSLWIVVINLLIFTLLRRIYHKQPMMRLIMVLGLLFLIPEGYGAWTLYKADQPNHRYQVSVGLVQPNIDPNAKWNHDSFQQNMRILHDLTDSVATQPRDLIVWPETATPTFLRRNHFGALDEIFDHLDRLGAALLTGVPDYEYQSNGEYKIYNATFLLQAHSRTIRDYRKIRLVPFGEYIPLSGYFPELKKLNLGQGNFDAGTEMKVYQIPLKCLANGQTDSTLYFNSVICYESTFPEIIRNAAQKGSELLVIVSNDAWFGRTSAPYLHAEIARFRAIENHLPVVRSANTGVSLIIDPNGRELRRLGFGKEGYLVASVPQGRPDTFFVRFGNWVGIVSVILSSGLLLITIFKKRKTCEN